MLIFNIVFFSLAWRIIGGGIMHLPRWIPVCTSLVLIDLQLDGIIQPLAYIYVFCVVRLLSTRPLLTATYGDTHSILTSFYRALPIIIALPFTSWWCAVFLAQGALYYVVGRIRAKYPVFPPTAVAELISGAIFGAII